MLDQALIALASAAGVAVAQAAGTDAWQGFRDRVARLFGRGPTPTAAEDAALVRLDRTAAELGGAPGSEEAVAAAWGIRFRDLLEQLGEQERAQVADQLRALVALAQESAGGTVTDESISIEGDVHIEARDGSAAALKMGSVIFGNPPSPGSERS